MPLRKRLPFLPRPIGTDRFFEPSEIEFAEMGCDLQRLRRRPGLVGVGGQHAIADQLAKRREIGAVGRQDQSRLSVSARDGPGSAPPRPFAASPSD